MNNLNNFKTSNYFYVIISFWIIILILGMIYSIYTDKLIVSAVCSLLFLKIVLIPLIQKTFSVELNEKGIKLTGIFKNRFIALKDVKDIQRIESKIMRKKTLKVIIELHDNDEIVLSGFNPSDELLYSACRFYLEKNNNVD